MVAEIMDTDDFDETTFLEQVDHITADPGETITLPVTDASTDQWQGIYRCYPQPFRCMRSGR